MIRSLSRGLRSLSLCAGLAVASLAPAAALADDRPADEILKELDATTMPEFNPQEAGNDEGYIEKYMAATEEAVDKRVALIAELLKAHSEHERAMDLRNERWQLMLDNTDEEMTDAKAVFDETAAFLRDHPDHAAAPHAAFQNAQATMWLTFGEKGSTRDDVIKTVSAFTEKYPRDNRGAQLLYMQAEYFTEHPKDSLALYERIKANYPDADVIPQVEESVEQARRYTDAVGKPFELTFTDAISGSEVSMENLRGKVVVVDFWATWCGPCVGEMPHMKELYAQHKDKGVEFIGVSLDAPEAEGGLDELKNFVKENEIAWPQYYQGNGWQSEFSQKWGINGIPTVFIVDADGNLYFVNARGRLDTLIPELLAKRGGKKNEG